MMKRILSIFIFVICLLIFLIVPTFSTAAPASEDYQRPIFAEVATPDEVQIPEELILGDVDFNGKVSIEDATLGQRHISKLTKLNDKQLDCLKINSTDFSILDITEIQKYLAKKSDNKYLGHPLGYEPPTEPETEPPTELKIKNENIVYTPIDHGTVGQGKPQDSWNGDVLTASKGVVQGPSGKETYYNLPMDGVVSIMRNMGFDEKNWPYWVREDGCKMLGNYIMCAADLNIRPRGSFIQSSLGMCIVCDTGGFIYSNSYQLDIATNW